jgi:hypothetical protein
MKSIGMGERVQVAVAGQGVPAEFTWRGRRHRIRAIEALRVESGRPGHRNLRCRTDAGLRCWLAHEAGRDIWRIERVLPTGG